MNRRIARERAKKMVEQMTVEEAAGQLRFDSPAIERLGIPAYNWWNEALHGVARAGTATSFPQAIGLGATFDRALMYDIGQAIALEGRAKYNAASKHGDRGIYKGLTFWSPNVNIFRDPRWGRGHETYGEDPFLTGVLGSAFVQGIQQTNKDGYLMAAACAKHFAAHSGPEKLRHSFNAEVSDKDLHETYLPAFERCVREAKVEGVMGAYNRLNGMPCCAHPVLMQQILRDKWGFEGYFTSDCRAIYDFHANHYVTGRPEESVKLALETGCEVNCGCTYQKIMNAYNEGLIQEETIRASAIRLFTTRILLGMFDKTDYDEIPYSVVECSEHLSLADRAAQESIVLLKNDGVLPIDVSRVNTIGVIGPNADSIGAMIGNYYGTSSRHTTVLQGIQALAGDARVLYSQGCELWRECDDNISEAMTVAEASDLVILCLGLDEHIEGEEMGAANGEDQSAAVTDYGDKYSLHLPQVQEKLMERIAAIGKPFVVCVLAGSALDLRFADEHANAVLQMWYPGANGGAAAARVLFGAEPGGRLPITVYQSDAQLPLFTDYDMRGHTYRYLTEKPLYPFGYGLSYANCSVTGITHESCTYEQASACGWSAEVTVSNHSNCPASQVIQVYIRVLGSPNAPLHANLCGLVRVELPPHGCVKQRIQIEPSAFFTMGADGEKCADGTGADIWVGLSQPDERSAELLNIRPEHIVLE